MILVILMAMRGDNNIINVWWNSQLNEANDNNSNNESNVCLM